jgi:hypothetical protein
MRHPYATAGGRLPRAQAVTSRYPRWYRGAIVRGGSKGFILQVDRARGALPRAPRVATLAATMACGLLVAGCGGGSRQDAGEPAGTFAVKVVNASFPATQSIARPTRLLLQVRNTGTRTVPDVAITINSFDYTSNYPELADKKRPVWAIETGPGAAAKPPVETAEVSARGGGQTAYVNTWALGALAPGGTQTFDWHVVPVKAGTYTVHYTVAAGLAGKATARLPSGAPVQGKFVVDIAPAPKLTHVNPSTGRVESGQFPISP